MVYSERTLYNFENSHLRQIYHEIKKRKGRFSRFAVFISIPGILFYLLFGWQLLKSLDSDFINAVFDLKITGTVDFLGFGLCGIMLMADDNKIIVSVPIIHMLIVAGKYLLLDSFAWISFIMFAYFLWACIMIFRDNQNLAIMKKMNLFPFNQRSDGRKPQKEISIDYDSIMKKLK